MNQLVGFGIGEWLHHQGTEPTEDGRGCADADGERKKGDDGEAARLGEIAQSETQVREHGGGGRLGAKGAEPTTGGQAKTKSEAVLSYNPRTEERLQAVFAGIGRRNLGDGRAVADRSPTPRGGAAAKPERSAFTQSFGRAGR